MPRSVKLFEHQGVEVIPAPTDFLVAQTSWEFLWHADWRTQLMNLLPDSLYMHWTTAALKEYIGLIVYELRGWM